MEKFGEHGGALVAGQLAGRFQAELEVPVAGAALSERLELHEQRRHEVERQLHPRELAHQRSHPEVILEPVHADPRQHVLARCKIFVVRLVHVPEDGDVGHGFPWGPSPRALAALWYLR